MGVSVKTLLTHLRQRQEQLGVQAFFFRHILRNNELEPAEYPEGAEAALNSKPVGHVNSSQKKEPEEEVIIPSIKGKGKETNPNPGIGTSDSTTYDPALMAFSLPTPPAQQHPFAYHQSALPGPQHNPASHNPAAPIVPPPLHPPIMPTDPRYAMMFHQYMSQMGNMGQQGWGAPPIPPAQQAFHPPEHHYGLQAPGGAMFPSIPLPTPFPPPFPSFDPHPIPPGEPPFSHLFHSFPMDQTSGPVMPKGPPITTPFKKNLTKTPGKTTPSKKNSTKTPVKTPGKRKRQEVEDSPSKTPTRVSSRQRTQTKPFEIQ